MSRLLIDDFVGGLNKRDSVNALATNETPESLNWTLDERGALNFRKGCALAVTLPGVSEALADIFYSAALNLWLCAREDPGSPNTYRLFSRPGDLSGSWTDRGQISNSVSARTVFVDWPGTTAYVVLATNFADGSLGGIYTMDAAGTLTRRSAGQTSALAVWQNKVWAISASVTMRLSRSPAGDPTTYTDFVDIREKDASPLTALGLAGGALLLFKKRAAYRVNDAATGAYSMIDSSSGCISPRALVALKGRLYSWGTDDLYEWDGVGAGHPVGGKGRPLFATAAELVGTLFVLCGGVLEDRVLYAFPSAAGGGDNDRLLEFNPEHRWLMVDSLAPGLTPSGPRSPGSVVNDDSYGEISWTNPGNATASDNVQASFFSVGGGPDSHYLKATDFGFTIPGDATITGIKVEVERHASAEDPVTDIRVRLVKSSVIQAHDKANPAQWPLSDAYATYGGAEDLWGLSWTPAEVNAADFGFALSARMPLSSQELPGAVDHIRITVYYIPVSAVADISSFAAKEATLYAAVHDRDQLLKVFTETPGADDDVPYQAIYRTPWLQPEGGKLAQLQKLTIQGLVDDAAAETVLTLRVYKDFDRTTFDQYLIDDDLRGGDSADDQEVVVLQSLGHSRAFAFEFVAGTAAGEVTIRSLELETVALER